MTWDSVVTRIPSKPVPQQRVAWKIRLFAQISEVLSRGIYFCSFVPAYDVIMKITSSMKFSRIQSHELHNHLLQSLWIVLTDASSSLVRTERVFSFSSLSTTFSRLSFIITVTSLTICRTSCSLSFGSCRVSVGGSCTLSIRMFIFSCSESEKTKAVRFLLDRYIKRLIQNEIITPVQAYIYIPQLRLQSV